MKKKKLACLVVLTAVILTAVFAWGFLGKRGSMELSAAVIYREGTESYKSVYSQLQHSLNATLTAECVKFDGDTDLSRYTMVYADKSIADGISPKEKDNIVNYVNAGGCIFAPNGLVQTFEPVFFGGSELKKIDALPREMDFPQVSANYRDLQQIIRDFHSLYIQYQPQAGVENYDYGYGFTNQNAVSLASCNGVSVFGVNTYGKGCVFYANPMLPNDYQVNNFNFEGYEPTAYMANTSLTANQILLSEFASFVSKRKYGAAVERVFGSFASPAAAWQLHYEEITGIDNDSAIEFSKMSQKYGQIASYTLIRNSFKWFNRTETITFFTDKKDQYKVNYAEDAYTQGTHVTEDNAKFLTYNTFDNMGEYFYNYTENAQTAYPCVDDFDNDGKADIISGSSDGFFYLNEGRSFKDNCWNVSAGKKLLDKGGKPISVKSYSSPYLYDFNRDGILDIISGSEEGGIFLFEGIGNHTYDEGKLLFAVEGATHTKPAMGDGDNDGIDELYVGCNQGAIYAFALDGLKQIRRLDGISEHNAFVSPYVYDYDEDGRSELVVGTFEGYIQLYKYENGEFKHIKAIETNEKNYLGNNNMKAANNTVPRFFDINNDGNDDLIIGSFEYGMAVPVDSPNFTLLDKLQRQVDYIKDNHMYMGMHMYTQSFASKEREKAEIDLHKKALKAYGLDTKSIGSNQHTWRTSVLELGQTYKTLSENGILWSSGSIANENFIYPQSSAENTLTGPFWLDYDNKKMLMLNTNTLLDSSFGDIAMKYGLPISVYYHCDLMYKNPQNTENCIKRIQQFVDSNGYTFVREDQLMKAIAAAYNSNVKVSKSRQGYKISAKKTDRGFDLYDKDFQNCVGIKIELAENENIDGFVCDANVWRKDKEQNCAYMSLDKGAALTLGKDMGGGHITNINIPAKVKTTGNEAEVKFKDDGLMQVFVSGNAEILSKGWTTEKKGDKTLIYKYGKAELLKLRF